MSQTKEEVPHIPMPRGAVDDPAWQSDYLTEEDKEKKHEIDRVLDPATAMQENPATKGLTLGEIKARDEDNLTLLLTRSREHTFPSPIHAIHFTVQAIRVAMEKMGIRHYGEAPKPATYDAPTRIEGNLYLPPTAMQDYVVREMVRNNVRKEVRGEEQYPLREDQWKRGIYFYHNGEIAYFISMPFSERSLEPGGGYIVTVTGRPVERWLVRTNVPVA